MKRFWIPGVIAVFALTVGPQAGGSRPRCAQQLPHGPALPAPIVVTTNCGRFRLQPSGDVVYRGQRTSPVPQGSNYFMDLTWYRFSRSRHLLIGRGLEQLWRSHNRYPARRRGYVGGVVLGARELSFDYSGRLYVARYGGREHLVARGEEPVAFLSGQLLSWRLHGFALVLRGAGTVAVPHAVEPLWDRAAGLVVFRTGRRIRAYDGHRVRELGNRYELGVRGTPVVEPLGRFVSLHDRRRLVLLGYEGRVVATAPLPKPRTQDDVISSAVVSNGGKTAVAFTATSRRNSKETVYVLASGGRHVRPVFTARPDVSGCGYVASLAWHGPWLLYASGNERVAVVDSTGRASVHLSRVVSRLPGRQRNGIFQVAWAPAP